MRHPLRLENMDKNQETFAKGRVLTMTLRREDFHANHIVAMLVASGTMITLPALSGLQLMCWLNM